MGILERFGVNRPNRAAITLPIAIITVFHDGASIVEILFAFGEEKQKLVAAGWTVLYTFGHGIGFIPYDIATQIPSISLQRKGQSPWDSNKIL